VAHARRYAKRYGVHFQQHRLRVVRFSALLSDMGVGKIDVLFLDVEGAELSALQTLDFRQHPVRYLVVERPSPAVTRMLTARGYDDLGFAFDSGGDRVFFGAGRESAFFL